MTQVTPVYSSLMQCLYDQQDPVVPHYAPYSIFRAVDSRDVTQQPTKLPHVHDFAVIWDDDHDTRIIAVIEEMLMAGLLPGVQFIGEHKGNLTVILAARTYWVIDVKEFAARTTSLTEAAGDIWPVRVGMFDHSPNNFRIGHQCDFQEIVGLPEEATHAYLLAIDGMWNLGTKEWQGVGTPTLAQNTGVFFPRTNRYVVAPNHRR